MIEGALVLAASAGEIGQDHQARSSAFAQQVAATRDRFLCAGLGRRVVAQQEVRVGGLREQVGRDLG